MTRNNLFAYTPLSEPRVVREQILKRSESDASYLASLYQECVVETDGVFPLDEDVLCTYMDQDALIDGAGLSETEKKIVDFLMQGYGLSDIADYLGHSRQATDILFDRAIDKMVAYNNQRWNECYSDRLFRGSLFDKHPCSFHSI